MVSLFYEYSNLESVRIYGMYRVTQAEYVICIRMATSQEYVNTYSTLRVRSQIYPSNALSILIHVCLSIRLHLYISVSISMFNYPSISAFLYLSKSIYIYICIYRYRYRYIDIYRYTYR